MAFALVLAAIVAIFAPVARAETHSCLGEGAESLLDIPDSPKELPRLAFQKADGMTLRLAAFRGQLVVLNLWATWCAPCVREMPSLDRLQAAMGARGLAVVALSEDRGNAAEKAQEFFTTNGLHNLEIYVDRQMAVARALAAEGLPTTVIVDPKGFEVGRVSGAVEWDSPEMQAALAGCLPPEVIKTGG